MRVATTSIPAAAGLRCPPLLLPFSPCAASPRSLRFLRLEQRCSMSVVIANYSCSSSSSSSSGTLNVGAVNVASTGVVGKNDLLIVGPGVLGRIVAEKWKKENPDCQIVGITMTADHHDELIKLGVVPTLRGSPINKFPYLIFCAPPSRTEDYPGEVRLAASNWSGEGSFLFTSSSAVYDCSDNGFCNEDSPVVPAGKSPRTDVLLKAENEALAVGGCVLRLAGLYKADRGAHTFWLGKGTVDSRPDHIVNLIHYEDAASLAIAIMKRNLRGGIFNGCDDQPLSRQELMDCVNRSKRYSKKFLGFTGSDGPLGKRMNNSKTRTQIGWQPKFTSFPQFLGLTD
ncbi:hypothetical protein Cni_G24520 [Canna indica]|uniref:NAD(P)-binding Rossmann-fold superfamily protein n=1 Tax=Canna indica TaxID=4628 RepID=A0AAQ3KW00_9LILI|nr:hypothetical protein Cni_G24520 [Canna indica]